MPIIENIDPDSVDSPIRSLLRPFTACPINVAPERQAELKALADKHQLRVLLDSTTPEFTYQVSQLLRTVRVGLPTLERLWAYAYAYFFFLELHREAGMGMVICPSDHPFGAAARRMILWALDAEVNRRLLPWPANGPTPERLDDPNVAPANELFLVMNGWILLHEMAHLELEHEFSPALSSEKSITQEEEADAWASHWILDRWRDYSADEAVFIKRTLGIAFGLSAFSGMEVHVEAAAHPTHPKAHRRLLTFLDTFVGEENGPHAKRTEIAWYAATAVLSVHLQNSTAEYDAGRVHATFRDFVLYAAEIIDRQHPR